jgi:hypothetical protein
MCVCVCVSSTLCHAGHILIPFQDTTLLSAQPPQATQLLFESYQCPFAKDSGRSQNLQSGNEMFLFRSTDVLQCLGTMVTAAFVDRSER